MRRLDSKGMTLIELVMVADVIGILFIVACIEFIGWQTRYKVESQVKDLYSDLMEMRARAMQTNIMHFMRLDATSDTTRKGYTVYRDASTAVDPQGDKIANHMIDTPVRELSQTGLEYMMHWNSGDTTVNITVDERGYVNVQRTVWLVDQEDKRFISGEAQVEGSSGVSDVEVDLDCVVIANTRINMGKLNDAGTTCEQK
ncbi:MAG: hypothetical protein JSV21_11845 [Nitrospirota bacterium]|nr:MAG: hypothetical protein JSV21_11845 [Nitrospirota bacterium]